MTISLDALLHEIRLELRGELPIILHSHGLASANGRHTQQGEPEPTYGHISGLPFSRAFERRLSHPDWWGINELAAASVLEVGDWCRSRHLSDLHRCPGRSTSLCERVVMALAEYGQPIGQVAWRESIDEELVYALAVQGLRHAFAWRHRRLHQYMRHATERERDSRVSCPLCEGRTVTMRRTRRVA